MNMTIQHIIINFIVLSIEKDGIMTHNYLASTVRNLKIFHNIGEKL